MAFCSQTTESECVSTPKITHHAPDSSGSEEETRSDCERCSICLGKCRNKCFTDSCLHYFCFNCLLEWSKIKAECPLCKQSFQSIIHNIKSMKEFDEYLVQPTRTASTTPSLGFPYLPHLPSDPHSRVFHRVNYFLPDSPQYTYRATMQVRPQQSDQIYQLFMQSNDATERYSREFSNDLIPFRQNAQEWREYIYNRRIYALPLDDMTGRSRECSVEFYRENPAQIYRLLPWVNRELVVLLRGNAFQIQVVMNYLTELLTLHDIRSTAFRAYFQRFLGHRTEHFIHELLNFSRSPYDMIGYDRHVRYAPYYRPETRNRQTDTNENEEVVISSDNESNSPQDLSSTPQDLSYSNNRRRNNRTEFTISTRLSSHSTVIFRGSIEASNNQSQQSSVNPDDTTSVNPPVSAENSEVSVFGNNGTVQIIRDVHNVSDTNSSDCEFVLERKPPHLRTPEMVSLNSESDSDVVFVNEEKREAPPGVFEQTNYNSDTSDSDDNKNLTMLRMKWNGAFNTDVKAGASKDPMPSTSTGGFTVGRHPIRLKFRKRVIKSIYESTSESDLDTNHNIALDKTMIPSVQYSTNTSEDEDHIDVVGAQVPVLKRKQSTFTTDSCDAQPKKRRKTTKKRKSRIMTKIETKKLKKATYKGTHSPKSETDTTLSNDDNNDDSSSNTDDKSSDDSVALSSSTSIE
ncbi:E3 ubiquitin-protein ligase Topors isoform X2 [Culicoides brevitarsis]|uniref:E3 ubiquitin-protein ligase Topors isoform X2 n=1 Tax=Culicoides brevitarsis TaxID=469753 RepID=UPI00307BEC1C